LKNLISGMLLVIAVFLANAGQAAYVWTDDNGKVRFADKYEQIPEKYRNSATGSETPEWKPTTEQERRDKKGTGAEKGNARPSADSTSVASSIPKFQVIAQYSRNLSILVPKDTTTERLKALIFEFMAARKSNKLSKMIPATTRGDRLGDYSVVSILVFSEPDWATSDKLKRFIESESDADLQFDKEYVKHIKATYSYVALLSSEQGALGYNDGVVRSPNYEGLWKDELVRKTEERVQTNLARKKLIEAQFSVWDGSHRNLEKLIKKNMNDPSSYKHVETRYWDMGDHLIVITKFRGKNAFGAVVVNWVKAKVDLYGNIVSVIEQGS
jgi:hypothetical protein